MSIWDTPDYRHAPYAPGGYIHPTNGDYSTRQPNYVTNARIRALEDRNLDLLRRIGSLSDEIIIRDGQNAELRRKLEKAETDKACYVHPLEHNMVKAMKNANRNMVETLKADKEILKLKNKHLQRSLDQLEGSTETNTTAPTIPNKEDVKPGEAWRVKTDIGVVNAIRSNGSKLLPGSSRRGYVWAVNDPHFNETTWYKHDGVELIEPLTPDTRITINTVEALRELSAGSYVMSTVGDVWMKLDGDMFVLVRHDTGERMYRDSTALLGWTVTLTLIHNHRK